MIISVYILYSLIFLNLNVFMVSLIESADVSL